MTFMRLRRVMACLGRLSCGSEGGGRHNNRRGQDGSAGPVGGYAVVVAWVFWLAAKKRGAATRAKLLLPRAFLGTIALEWLR